MGLLTWVEAEWKTALSIFIAFLGGVWTSSKVLTKWQVEHKDILIRLGVLEKGQEGLKDAGIIQEAKNKALDELEREHKKRMTSSCPDVMELKADMEELKENFWRVVGMTEAIHNKICLPRESVRRKRKME